MQEEQAQRDIFSDSPYIFNNSTQKTPFDMNKKRERPLQYLQNAVYPTLNKALIELVEQIMKSDEIQRYQERLKEQKVLDRIQHEKNEKQRLKDDLGSQYETSEEGDSEEGEEEHQTRDERGQLQENANALQPDQLNEDPQNEIEQQQGKTENDNDDEEGNNQNQMHHTEEDEQNNNSTDRKMDQEKVIQKDQQQQQQIQQQAQQTNPPKQNAALGAIAENEDEEINVAKQNDDIREKEKMLESLKRQRETFNAVRSLAQLLKKHNAILKGGGTTNTNTNTD